MYMCVKFSFKDFTLWFLSPTLKELYTCKVIIMPKECCKLLIVHKNVIILIIDNKFK